VADEIKVKITGDYDSKGADEAIKDAKEIEKLDPELKITADADAAVTDIDKVTEAAQALSREDTVIKITAQIDAAKADLERLQTELINTGEKAEDTARQLDRTTGGGDGSNLRGNAIADLTGPLGDASGAASDFAGVFDGLGDIASEAGRKMGLSQQAAGQLSSVIGGLGVVAAAGVAVWTMWNKKQEEAKKKAEEHRKAARELFKAIEEGNSEASADKFIEMYQDVIDKGIEAGLSVNEIVDGIRGIGDAVPASNSKLDELNTKIGDLSAARDDFVSKSGTTPFALESAQNLQLQIDKLVEQKDALLNSRDAYQEELAASKASDTQRQEVIDSLGDVVAAEIEAKNKVLLYENQVDSTTLAVNTDVALMEAKWDELHGKIDKEKALLTYKQQVEDLKQAHIDAGTAATEHGAGSPEHIAAVEAVRLKTLDLETETVNLAQKYTDMPAEKVTELVAKIDAGSIETLPQEIDAAVNSKDYRVSVHLDRIVFDGETHAAGSTNIRFNNASASGSVSVGVSSAPQQVNVNLPRGARAGDISKALGVSARRNGTLFANPVVTYAK